MDNIRLGIIGLSQGNGHPYSWSAICNGYDREAMETCGFPIIPRYLERQQFPDDGIRGARVTHAWTQDPAVTRHLATTCFVENVVSDPRDMLGVVDALLLARDDAERHRHFAEPFLRAGVPIYVDKPLALSLESANNLLELSRYPGQVFSCSALRFALELQLDAAERTAIGAVLHVEAVAPKDWDRYSVHAIEPLCLILPASARIESVRTERVNDVHSALFIMSGSVSARVTCLGAAACPISLSVFGTHAHRQLTFTNTFAAFRSAIEAFLESVRSRRPIIPVSETLRVVEFIERGREPNGG